jgi:DNA-binding response OmpR family regulator
LDDFVMNSSFSSLNSDSTPGDLPSLRDVGIREIVIVDTSCDRYADFVAAAQAGEVGLHFCVDGRSAIRLSRRFRADAWLVSTELPDMSGFDLLSMLSQNVLHGEVDPLMDGSRVSLDRVGEGMRPGVFLVSDTYSLEDEQRSLASGVAGYLVRPVTVDVIRASRTPHVAVKEMAD